MKTNTNYQEPNTIYKAHVIERETGKVLESFEVRDVNRTCCQRKAHVMPEALKYSKGFLNGSLTIKLERVSPRF